MGINNFKKNHNIGSQEFRDSLARVLKRFSAEDSYDVFLKETFGNPMSYTLISMLIHQEECLSKFEKEDINMEGKEGKMEVEKVICPLCRKPMILHNNLSMEADGTFHWECKNIIKNKEDVNMEGNKEKMKECNGEYFIPIGELPGEYARVTKELYDKFMEFKENQKMVSKGDNDIPGCRVSMSWDKINNMDWIIFRNQEGKEIIRVDKTLWDTETGVAGFTPEMRDSIITKIRNLYG